MCRLHSAARGCSDERLVSSFGCCFCFTTVCEYTKHWKKLRQHYSIAEQQQAQDSSGDAVVAGAAGAAAFLAHSTRAVLRDAARRDGAL